MKLYKKILRYGVLLLIILLGLTVVAPEWLDLKDIIIAGKKSAEVEQASSGAIVSIGTINNVNNAISGIFPAINQRIVGVSSPDIIGAPGGIIFLAVWFLFAIVMYLLFFLLCFFIFLLMSSFLKSKISFPKHHVTFLLVRLVSSIFFTFLIWPYIILAMKITLTFVYKVLT